MTLLLGPPSSGKTTLLLALAGKLDPKLKVRIRTMKRSTFILCNNVFMLLVLFSYLKALANIL